MQITVTGIGSELQGVGRAEDGRAAFIPFALPGETVEVSIAKSSDRYVECRLDRVLTSSHHRIEPVCPLYGECGGCRAQHVVYDAGLRLKQHVVAQSLRRLGGLPDADVRATLGSAYPWRYRNKGEYAIASDRATNTAFIGLCKANSHQVVPVKDCLLQHDLSVRVLQAVTRWMQVNCVPAWDSKHKDGGLRYLVTRVTRSGDVMVILCTTGRRLPATGSLQQAIEEEIGPNLRSLYQLTLNKKPAHALDGSCRLLAGKKSLHEKLLGLNFEISPQTFFQVNTELTEVLYSEAIKAADLNGSELVLDVYCGVGTISLALAQKCKYVVGVELNPQSIANAKLNAERNHLSDKTEFIAGDAADEVLRLFDKGLRPDVIVVDPPRKGVEGRLLEAMVRCSPEKIVYVSCNPATLARDLKILLADGSYRLEYAQPVDMFAQTEHVETVALLRRNPDYPFEGREPAGLPLLYQASQNAVYGEKHVFDSGNISDALFVYLDGEPSPDSIRALEQDFRGRPLVALTAAWEDYIKEHYPDAKIHKRYMMKPSCQFALEDAVSLPDGYRAGLFDERAFDLHPFSHGENYPDFESFRQHGSGAVIWHNDQIVASASSFLTLGSEVELDVSTEEEHRGQGLAAACISLMLRDCAQRGLTVHWDAQNSISRHLARKFGLEEEFCYSVYSLPKEPHEDDRDEN